jgi:hypothetical protein
MVNSSQTRGGTDSRGVTPAGYAHRMSAASLRPPLTTALVYDFDGTLARGNIQEPSLIREHLELTPSDFWGRVGARKREVNADAVLTYMQMILERAAELGKPITAELLREHGRGAALFAGVTQWFARIDAYAAERGLALEHYVVSSANEEMLRGAPIAERFRHIFGCRYAYDAHGRAVWPAVAINYTSKTQFLFRINKGVLDVSEDEALNRWVPMDERPVPFSRMVYLGDGDTDIPSMKMVRHQGGHSIAVFDPDEWGEERTQSKVHKLIAEDRAHFVVPADYRRGSQLDVTVRGVLGRLARDQAGYRGD